jgi:uncharacterized protein (TIGR00725 family)
MTKQRKPVVGVMGGHRVSAAVTAMAQELGSLIAQRGWVLLNGGRDAGVMAASARGAKESGGIVIGVLPDSTRRRASADLDFAILTGLGDARNLINIYSSDVVIACPGGLGTLSEVTFALKHDKTVILLGFEVGPELDRYRKGRQLREARRPADAVAQAAEVLRDLGLHSGLSILHHQGKQT